MDDGTDAGGIVVLPHPIHDRTECVRVWVLQGYTPHEGLVRCAISMRGWSDTICDGKPEWGTSHIADGPEPRDELDGDESGAGPGDESGW